MISDAATSDPDNAVDAVASERETQLSRRLSGLAVRQ